MCRASAARASGSVTPAGSSRSAHSAYQPSSAAGRSPDGTGRPTRGGRGGTPPRGRLAGVAGPRRRPAAVRCRPGSSAGRARPAGARRRSGRRSSASAAPRSRAGVGSRRPRRRARAPAVARPGRRRGTGSRARTASRISSSSAANAGSHAESSPPKDTIPSRPSRSGSAPEVLLDRAQRRGGMAEERLLQVVDNGDARVSREHGRGQGWAPERPQAPPRDDDLARRA